MTTTTVSAVSQAGTVSNFASGAFTSDGNVTIVSLGFKPRYLKVLNETDVLIWEKFEGQVAANSLKTNPGTTTASDTITTTVETGSDIVINTDNTVTLSAALVGTSKALRWIAFG